MRNKGNGFLKIPFNYDASIINKQISVYRLVLEGVTLSIFQFEDLIQNVYNAF